MKESTVKTILSSEVKTGDIIAYKSSSKPYYVERFDKQGFVRVFSFGPIAATGVQAFDHRRALEGYKEWKLLHRPLVKDAGNSATYPDEFQELVKAGVMDAVSRRDSIKPAKVEAEPEKEAPAKVKDASAKKGRRVKPKKVA
jgi:hypothetical protein